MKMMLEWYELTDEAIIVQDAIEYVINQNSVTPDLGGKSTTAEVGHAIANRVRQLIG
jgi:isocitrate/isopropylmalate dehydrogenase